MSAFARASRERTNGVDQRAERERDRAPNAALFAGTLHPTAGDVLNQSPTVQAQLRLGQALNQSPRFAAQFALAQTLARPAATAAPSAQLGGIAINDEPVLEREADLMGAAAAQLEPAMRAQDRPLTARETGEQTRSPARRAQAASTRAPVQRIWGWLGGGLGAASGAYTGAALGSLVGPAGTVIGGIGGAALGALAGYFGGGRAGLVGTGGVLGASAGAYYGGTAGAALGPLGIAGGAALGGVAGGLAGAIGGTAARDLAPAKSAVRLSDELAPSIGRVVLKRAFDLAAAGVTDDDQRLDTALKNYKKFLDAPLRDFLDTPQAIDAFKSAKGDKIQKLISVIDVFYTGGKKVAAAGQYGEDTQNNPQLSLVLEQNPFIKKVLAGDFTEQSKNLAENDEKKLDKKDATKKLSVPQSAPARVHGAAARFNQLVDRDVPDIAAVSKNWLDPGSGIAHDDILRLGWGSPTGAALHELGHQFEYSLTPGEFGTLHNFLRARSRSDRLRHIGYETMTGGLQSDRGYDIEQPPLDITTSRSLLKTGASAVSYGLGGPGERHLDDFIIQHANTRQTSYNSKVGDEAYDTEFLSTTIHFFNRPDTAKALVQADPLRVCLFLSFAQPQQYEAVSKAFAALKPKKSLDELIHKLA